MCHFWLLFNTTVDLQQMPHDGQDFSAGHNPIFSIKSHRSILVMKFEGVSKTQFDLEGIQDVSDADLRLTTWYSFPKSTERVKIILFHNNSQCTVAKRSIWKMNFFFSNLGTIATAVRKNKTFLFEKKWDFSVFLYTINLFHPSQ